MNPLHYGLAPKMKPVSPKRRALVAALDLGTSKIVCLIARLQPQSPREALRRRSLWLPSGEGPDAPRCKSMRPDPLGRDPRIRAEDFHDGLLSGALLRYDQALNELARLGELLSERQLPEQGVRRRGVKVEHFQGVIG